MCTLTWHARDDGYEVFFNRDERRCRRPGLPPRIGEARGVAYVAPRDGDFGGTWILADASGLSVCLLNGFAESNAPAPAVADDDDRAFTSRGLVPLELIGAGSAGGAMQRVRALDLERFRPFLLLAFDPHGGPWLARWSGSALRVEAQSPADQPLVSSSFYSEQVRRSRTELFQQLHRGRAAATPTERHLAFHASHLPQRGPYSPCMHRPDARTVSFTHVEVSPQRVRLHYTGDAPCRGRPEPVVWLERAG